MKGINLGKINTMTVVKSVDFGMYLDGGDEGEILLPTRYVPEGCKPGDVLDVFVYLDQDERPIATTLTPKAMVGEFAYLEVAWVNKFGAFLDWGLMKDLFCPFREQKMRMIKGNSYIVHVHLDKESYRIVASAKVEHYLSDEMPSYHHGAQVDLLVWQKTDLGFKVIVGNKFGGLVYKDQVFQYLHTGDRLKGYVSNVRPDGKLDISLQPSSKKRTKEFADTLLEYLNENNGYCNLGDKSDAEEIYERFEVSKKTFKKGVGDLYKKHLITLEEGGKGIKLVDK